jgi:hypothetical protein
MDCVPTGGKLSFAFIFCWTAPTKPPTELIPVTCAEFALIIRLEDIESKEVLSAQPVSPPTLTREAAAPVPVVILIEVSNSRFENTLSRTALKIPSPSLYTLAPSVLNEKVSISMPVIEKPEPFTFPTNGEEDVASGVQGEVATM